jgi:hypothetical protein
MIKSFILAATSIAYILSISVIADAKVQKINKRIDRSQSCQNPVDTNSQYNQLAKEYPDELNDFLVGRAGSFDIDWYDRY